MNRAEQEATKQRILSGPETAGKRFLREYLGRKRRDVPTTTDGLSPAAHKAIAKSVAAWAEHPVEED